MNKLEETDFELVYRRLRKLFHHRSDLAINRAALITEFEPEIIDLMVDLKILSNNDNNYKMVGRLTYKL